MASSWNPALLERVARVTAVEVAATGVHWTFSPVLCITRDLRWGRVGETFGEDPYLIGELASAMVRGYQGDGLKDPTAILATAKHFAGYAGTRAKPIFPGASCGPGSSRRSNALPGRDAARSCSATSRSTAHRSPPTIGS
jgi:beta-glucosidase-like glycosyl hydrolase